MWSKPFWRGAAERALKTAAQVASALLVADGADLLTLDWTSFGVTVATATALSVLSSVISSPLGPEQTIGSATLVDDVADQ